MRRFASETAISLDPDLRGEVQPRTGPASRFDTNRFEINYAYAV